MSKKRRKEVGKVIVKKKARRVSLPRRVRVDIIVIALILVAIGATAYGALTASRGGGGGEKLDVGRLYEGLNSVVNQKNRNSTVDLLYLVRGDLPMGSEVLGIKDYVRVNLRYYSLRVTPRNTTSSNTTEQVNATRIEGILAFYIGADYIEHLLNLTGFRHMLKNLSQLVVNAVVLRNATKGGLTVEDLGEEVVRLGEIGGVTARKTLYRYVTRSGGVTYRVEAVVWHDVRYGLPVKAEFSINGYKLRLELRSFEVRLS